jgi:hypothetical protein
MEDIIFEIASKVLGVNKDSLTIESNRTFTSYYY